MSQVSGGLRRYADIRHLLRKMFPLGGNHPLIGFADGGGARRIVEIVCRPSVGAEWGTDAFQSAWEEMGLEDSDVWFPESPLLRSTRAELLT